MRTKISAIGLPSVLLAGMLVLAGCHDEKMKSDDTMGEPMMDSQGESMEMEGSMKGSMEDDMGSEMK